MCWVGLAKFGRSERILHYITKHELKNEILTQLLSLLLYYSTVNTKAKILKET